MDSLQVLKIAKKINEILCLYMMEGSPSDISVVNFCCIFKVKFS